MQPIHELLNRIHWDPEFGKGKFELEIWDRIEDTMIRIPLQTAVFFPEEPFFFHYLDDEGYEHRVPFHRIKSVYKDGECIWHRTH